MLRVAPRIQPRPCVHACLAPFPAAVLPAIDAFAARTAPAPAPALRRYLRPRDTARRLAQFLASTARPARAHSLMALAHALGCRFKPNHFEAVAHQLSLRARWSLIPRLVALAADQCGKSTARLLNWKTRALIECHRFARLHRVLDEFHHHRVSPTRRTFHLLVSGHLRNQDLRAANNALHLMQDAGFPVDHSTHALIVAAYRSLGLDPHVHARALDALRHVAPPTSTRILNSIIQHHLDIRDEPGAAPYITQMLAPPRSESVASTGPDGALPSPGPVVHPDPATFTILLNHLNARRQFHRVVPLLRRMRDSAVRPDAGLAAALIRTYALSHRDDIAISILAAMLPSADAQNLFALLRVKPVPHLPLDVNGIPLSVHVFNALLPRLMEIRGLGGARCIFRVMRSNGIQSNPATIELFLNYLARVRHIHSPRLAHILRNMSRKTHGPTIRHHNILLRHALRTQKHRACGTGWDATAAKFSSTRRCPPSFHENHLLLSSEHFAATHQIPQHGSFTRPALSALARKAIHSDRATFAMWLKHEAIVDPTLGTATSVFHHMVDRGIHPNRHHFTSLIAGFARAGDLQGAQELMRSAKAAGFEPDVIMWTVLISGYARKGEPALAMRTFRAMVAAGVSPDVPAIDALAHAYFAVGAYARARRVLLELWPRVKPFPDELKNAPLKQLARAFRQSGPPGPAEQGPLTPDEQRSFNQRLRQVLREWRRV